MCIRDSSWFTPRVNPTFRCSVSKPWLRLSGCNKQAVVTLHKAVSIMWLAICRRHCQPMRFSVRADAAVKNRDTSWPAAGACPVPPYTDRVSLYTSKMFSYLNINLMYTFTQNNSQLKVGKAEMYSSSVSYTHLDVYKRQHHINAPNTLQVPSLHTIS